MNTRVPEPLNWRSQDRLVSSVSALPAKYTTVLALQQTVYFFCTTRWLINEASIDFTSLRVQQRDGLRANDGVPQFAQLHH